jgi:ribosome-associated heat shock protein Hsp15
VDATRQTLRADKWLWHARFFKTRGLATKVISAGHLRVNGAHAAKPSHAVGPGDVLTFPQGWRIRVVRVRALSERRGPAPEAQALYDDLTPPDTPQDAAARPSRLARPERNERREALKLKKGGTG